MLQSDIDLSWFALALNLERNDVAGVRVRCQQIRELDFAIKRIDVVAVLINVVIPDRGHDVALLQSCLICRGACLDISYVNAALALFRRELAQRGVPRREKCETGRWETTIILTFRFSQEMRDDRRRDSIEQLRARIVTQQ